MFFPVYLNLNGKRVVVIGGGEVAERKVASLAGTGAAIVVISPTLTPQLLALAESNAIEWQKRNFARGDSSGATLVLSATNDPAISREVWEEATTAGILVNTADQPALCDFIMPAVVRRGELAVAISTGGASPALAATLREKLSEMLGPGIRGPARNTVASAGPRSNDAFRTSATERPYTTEFCESNLIGLLKRQDRDSAERLLREIIEDFACQERTS